MPHAVLNPGTLTATGRGAPRQLVPGIGPGGSRLGHPTKAALLIKKTTVIINTLTRTAGADIDIANISLLLSHNESLTPGLRLNIANIIGSGPATAVMESVQVTNFDYLAGTVWAPRWLGILIGEATGGWNGINVDVHIDYDVVDVEWMDWLIMWDFIDNIVDLDEEY